MDGVETETLPFHKISELIRGESGTEVKLSVRHLDKKEAREITVKRGPIHRDSVEGEHVDAEGKRIYFLETEPEIAYIRITSFSNRTAEEVADALQAIKERPSKGLILDLRGNPGGFVSVCVEIANYFIHPTEENDVIVSTRYQNGKTKENYRTRRDGQLFEKPMVVLIDGDSASASEILSAALQDYHRAAIVGQRSFGKGIVQEIFTLPLKSGKLQLTDASYWRPNGQNIHRTKDAKETDQWGVTPDPEGLVSVSQEQSFAQLQIRERRSNILAPDLDPVVSEYLTQLPKEVEAHLKYIRSMEKEEKSLKDDGEQNNGEFEGKEKGTPESPDDSLEQKEKTPFVLEGNAPYYDPQLEKGIEILLKRVS